MAGSHPPGAVVGTIPACTGGSAGPGVARGVRVPEDWRQRESVNVSDGMRLVVLTPAVFLPLRLAHMPQYAPDLCVANSVRHGDWARLVLSVRHADAGSVTTSYGPTGTWFGRSLLSLHA